MNSLLSQECFLICEKSNKDNKSWKKEQNLIQNIQDFKIYFNKGKFSLIIDKQNIVHFLKKGFKNSKYYEKNNNIIIDFEKEEKEALLLMNNSKELKNLVYKNIFVVNYTECKNTFYLFNEVLNLNNLMAILKDIDYQNTIFPIENYPRITSKQNKRLNNNYLYKDYGENPMNENFDVEIKKMHMIKEKKKIQRKSIERQQSAPNNIKKKIKAQNLIDLNNINNNNTLKPMNNQVDKILVKIIKQKNYSFHNKKRLIEKKQNSNYNLKVQDNLHINNNDLSMNNLNKSRLNNNHNNINIALNKKIQMKPFNNFNLKNKEIIKIDFTEKNIKNDNNAGKQSENVNQLIEIIKNQNERLKIENSELIKSKQKLITLKSKYSELIEELNQKKKELEQLKSKELKHINENNKFQINFENERIKEKNKEIDRLQKEKIELENKYKKIIENYEQNQNSEIFELQKKKEELERKLKISEEKNNQNVSELQNNIKEINLLKTEINELKKTIKIKDEQILKLLSKIKKLEKLIDQLKEENNKLLLQNTQNSMQGLENNIQTNTRLINTEYKYSNIRKKNNKISIVAKSTEETNSIDGNIHKEKEIEKLKEKNKEDMNKLLTKEKEIQRLKKEIAELNNLLNSLNSENNELKQNAKELENKLSLLKQKELELSKLKAKNTELEKNNEKQNKLINMYEKKINNYVKEIENSNKNIEIFTKQIKDYQKNELQKQNLMNKEKELKEREDEIIEKEKELNEKIMFLENKENLLESESQKIQKTNASIQQYLQEINNLKIANDNLIKQNQQLKNEIINYKQMLSNMQPNNNIQPKNIIPLNSQNVLLPQNNQQQNNIFLNFNNQIINNNNNNNNNMNNHVKNNNIIIFNNKINHDNVIIPQNKNPEPIKLYTTPTLIGLNNIGATCFMNATLQCLSQTEALTNYFLKEKNKDKIINNNIAKVNQNEKQLSPAYLELIQKLWEINGPKSFSPYTFMNKVVEMNPLFKKGEAGDAKDFIIFVLEQLHKELKMPVKLKDNNKVDEVPLNQYDKMNALNNFFEDFKKETSILTDTFFGFNETTNVCLYCKNNYNSKGKAHPICYNYGVFNLLIFPLEEVKNFKINIMKQNNIPMNQINQVNLYECFVYNQKTDLFTGENRNYCNICKQLYDSHYTSKIFVSPNVLIMILNRGKGNIYKVKLDFQQIIDITEFVIQKEKPKIQYTLYGVITHLGESGPNAHFVASCKSPVDGYWYRYNDAIVEPIKDFKKDVYDYGNPYILFYQKIQ